ncbi:hypothetical protein ACIQC9_01410 [Brevundimonas sp. NPDC092305]|uniref:hypothetical protein n=1 Tax=Brevundimonas sp. NPDC092305 TaxID=3363957 RepID=UPI0038296271
MTSFSPRPVGPFLAGLVAIAAASGVQAQSFEEAKAAARRHEIEHQPPIAGVEQIAARNRDWSVNSFYRLWTGQGTERSSRWVIRRITRDDAGPRYADARDCPAVNEVLAAIEDLPPPIMDMPGIGREAPGEAEIVLDGVSQTLWARFARAGTGNASVNVEITGNVNSPAAIWWGESLPKLDRCWASTLTP